MKTVMYFSAILDLKKEPPSKKKIAILKLGEKA